MNGPRHSGSIGACCNSISLQYDFFGVNKTSCLSYDARVHFYRYSYHLNLSTVFIEMKQPLNRRNTRRMFHNVTTWSSNFGTSGVANCKLLGAYEGTWTERPFEAVGLCRMTSCRLACYQPSRRKLLPTYPEYNAELGGNILLRNAGN